MFEYDLRFRLLDFSFLSSDSHSASTIAHKLQIVMQNPSEPLKKRSSIAGSLRWIALKSFRRSSMHLVSYQEEIINLSQYGHPNLVTPIAYSCDTETRVFVNEFMAGGSLDHHLFIAQKPLPWATRMRVGVGAARGLAFLHSLQIPVIYVVLKSGDILLDADFNAKLSDFGIIKDVFTHEIEGPWGVITLQIESKYGPYAAPEFVDAGRRSTKGDVYSFGVVLLELISGHQEGRQPKEWQNLIMDLGKKRRLSRIMDSRLEGEYPPKEAYKVAKIALQCVSFDPILRPTMADVVAELEYL